MGPYLLIILIGLIFWAIITTLAAMLLVFWLVVRAIAWWIREVRNQMFLRKHPGLHDEEFVD